ncbi:MAG TPA: trehalose-6-phosphate synthase [Thermoanaerobaculia bacterium]|jgi:trehalose 6-phosphate synthase|nr:trehalose-6-phosphate synthase [Thermoanaerobaculia bacterium]
MSTTASATAISDLRLPEPSISVGSASRPAGRCVVVSDRLPIVLTREGGQGWRVSPSGGALISALKPVLNDRRGVWIGWPGVTQEEAPGLRKVLAGAIQEGGGFSLRPVSVTDQEKRLAYRGFSGEAVWPLFHDLPLECTFSPSHWQAFLKVNRKFARAAARTLARGAAGTDLVWVQGHLLMNLAAELKRLGATCRTAFFLHLPFPGPDLFLKIPWREELLAGLLAFDQLGFQTRRDFGNFLACVKALAPSSLQRVRAGVFPVGVDARQIEERAAGPEVEARLGALRSTLDGRRLIFGIDGLDRSKGIPEKLRAFAELLTRHPELQDQVTLVQVATPSHEGGPRHAALRAEIERLTGEINGYFGRPGWVPVHYLHRELDRDELLAYYRAADVALVTPLKAGMHLAAKEFCAANLEERGVLVLSEFAGAAEQLGDRGDRRQGALLVNPFDSQQTARVLCRALRMKDRERAARMRKLRAEVRRHDVSWWAGSFLASAFAEPLGERSALRNS